MKIVVAPDKFKGSLSSLEAAQAIKRGIKKAYPDAQIILCPLADGGEGTVEALVHVTNGQIIHKKVKGPLSRPVIAYFGITGQALTADFQPQSGVVEMAAASGLHLLQPVEQNPMLTTTYGTGELIKAALDKNCREIIIGIGGSATVDGGMGMAQALGVKFLDKSGRVLSLGCGKLLSKVEKIDTQNLDKRISKTHFLIASDVQNPLCGREGAAYVYAPQKGATLEMVRALDKGLSHYADIIKRDLGKDIKNVAGSGAAGGLGAGLIAFLNAELRSGVDLIMKVIGFEKKLQGADLVITGEGKIDAQTAYGKVLAGVAKVAKVRNIPVIAIGGQVAEDARILYKRGFKELYSLVGGKITVKEAMKNAAQLLERITEKILIPGSPMKKRVNPPDRDT